MPPTTASRRGLHAKGLIVSFSEAARNSTFRALDIDKLACRPGRLHVVTGPSGSGKSTLLYTVSGLAAADEGTIHWDDTELSALSEASRDQWRRRNVGFVFQSFHLIKELNATDNVLLPVWFGQWRAGAMEAEAKRLLSDLKVPAGRGPVGQMSRGEQQRVALARALIFNPPVILADEPTASLDASSAAGVTNMLYEMAHEGNRTVIAVSHDQTLIEKADCLIELERGRLRHAVTQPGATIS